MKEVLIEVGGIRIRLILMMVIVIIGVLVFLLFG